MRARTSTAKIVDDMMFQRKRTNANLNSALKFRTTMEPKVINWLRQENYDIRLCGLFLDPEVLGIVGSPNGLIGDDEIC